MITARVQVAAPYRACRDEIENLHRHFDVRGIPIHSGRNLIKTMTMIDPGGGTMEVAVKSFKIPARPQGFVYASFRPSKAWRSMSYARKLLDLKIETPEPVACIEYTGSGCLRHSYYVCRYWPHDHDLTAVLYGGSALGPSTDRLLEQLVRFTFRQHQKGVAHLDYNPGNLLCRARGSSFEFALVDLNRLRFAPLELKARISGLVRLTSELDYLRIIGKRYAELYGADADEFCRRLEKTYLRFVADRRRMKSVKSLLRR